MIFALAEVVKNIKTVVATNKNKDGEKPSFFIKNANMLRFFNLNLLFLHFFDENG